MYEEELFCLAHRKKVSALCLLYKICHRVDNSMSEYLNHFVTACNTRASAALDELALVIPRCRTDPFSQSFLPAVVRVWNLLPSSVLSSCSLSSFKKTMNLCIQRAYLDFRYLYFSLFLLLYNLLGLMVLGSF